MDPFAVSASRRTVLLASLASLLPLSKMAWAADAYPTKGITFVAPWPPGGGSELIVRAISPVMEKILGQPVVVDHRPGATGTLGSKLVANSKPDGYTIVLGTADSHSIFPQLLKTAPYDAKKDFTALAPIGITPSALVAHKSVEAKNMAELAEFAKASSRTITYGSWGVGSSAQIMMESISKTLGIKMLHVPFPGSGPMHTAVMGGHIDLAILPIGTIMGSIKGEAANYHVLGMNTENRIAEFPDIPTLAEQGITVLEPWVGILGPANLPVDIQVKLHDAITKAVSDPEVQKKFASIHLISKTMSLEEYQQSYAGEYDKWGALIEAANISIE